ncbi:hypothetical protein OGATHE_001258 [Ogataea polymorpha]|uniref:Uncharacterized protein n=1 Tax=Ogataea polymorpha TaxID=460523 RepID=A0A9P8PQW8_9ASCO|nr:hypothetical protein OGATHE_001258 [Ogataea polymorpha]
MGVQWTCSIMAISGHMWWRKKIGNPKATIFRNVCRHASDSLSLIACSFFVSNRLASNPQSSTASHSLLASHVCVTVACSVRSETCTAWTPSTFFSASVTALTQELHVMPPMVIYDVRISVAASSDAITLAPKPISSTACWRADAGTACECSTRASSVISATWTASTPSICRRQSSTAAVQAEHVIPSMCKEVRRLMANLLFPNKERINL